MGFIPNIFLNSSNTTNEITVWGVILIQKGKNPLYTPLKPSVWNVLIIASTGEVYLSPFLSVNRREKQSNMQANHKEFLLDNLFMAHHEKKWLNEFSGTEVLFCRQYLDDTFCVFDLATDAELFFQFINSCHTNIQFTIRTKNISTHYLFWWPNWK